MANTIDLARVDLLARLRNLLQDRLEGEIRTGDHGGGLALEADFVGLDACGSRC